MCHVSWVAMQGLLGVECSGYYFIVRCHGCSRVKFSVLDIHTCSVLDLFFTVAQMQLALEGVVCILYFCGRQRTKS